MCIVTQSLPVIVFEDMVLSFCKLRPSFNLNIVFFQEFLGFNLLAEGVCFNLVHSRNHFIMTDQVRNPIRLEIADSDEFILQCRQLQVAKILYGTFSADQDLASSSGPDTKYNPDPTQLFTNPAQYSRQGIGRATLEQVLDSLIDDGKVITVGEYKTKFGIEEMNSQWRKSLTDPDAKPITRAINIFRRFHPADKPILWSILLTQLFLYLCVDKIRSDSDVTINDLKSYIHSLKNDKKIREKLRWSSRA